MIPFAIFSGAVLLIFVVGWWINKADQADIEGDDEERYFGDKN